MDSSVIDSIQNTLASNQDRVAKAEQIAEVIRAAHSYRWVGIYDVRDQEISVVAWSGPGSPTYPRFPVSQGLNGAAVASRRAVIVNDVTSDPRYLTTLSSTQSEIVVPVIDAASNSVIGTIDAESIQKNAFSETDRLALETCARALLPLWP